MFKIRYVAFELYNLLVVFQWIHLGTRTCIVLYCIIAVYNKWFYDILLFCFIYYHMQTSTHLRLVCDIQQRNCVKFALPTQ